MTNLKKGTPTVHLGDDWCVICGKNKAQAGTLHRAHILAKSKGGRVTATMCPNHHAMYDAGKFSEAQLAKIGVTPSRYSRYRPSRRKGGSSTVSSTKSTPQARISTGERTAFLPNPMKGPDEKQALENWKRKMRDILSKLRSLDPKKHSQTVTEYVEKLRYVVNDLPYLTVIRWADETRNTISDFVDYLDTLLPPKWMNVGLGRQWLC